jgi:hypothetical protein
MSIRGGECKCTYDVDANGECKSYDVAKVCHNTYGMTQRWDYDLKMLKCDFDFMTIIKNCRPGQLIVGATEEGVEKLECSQCALGTIRYVDTDF